MTKTRLEAFSDGVIAILITIMVLELKAPLGDNWAALLPAIPGLSWYVLSFVYLGIYWNNHHHMLHLVHRVNGKILWANLHLLFWLSLIPFGTAWMGENHAAAFPTVAYGVVLLFSAVAYYVLQTVIVSDQGPDSKLGEAIGSDLKGKASIVLYLISLPLAYVHRGFAIGIYVFVALVWLVPDPRIEKKLS